MRPPEEITALVTGATDGLGRSVATQLAKRGARVIVHGRDHERGVATRAARSARRPATTESSSQLADFASLAEVRELAEARGGDRSRSSIC